MGVLCCSYDEKTPLGAAVKQASEREDVFFVTQLGKCAVRTPYQLYIPKNFVEYCASRQWELKQNQELLLEGYEIGFWWKVLVLVTRSRGGSKISSARIGRGWRDFAIANGVEVGDNVLFTLVRTNRFLVKFFHPDGRQKKKKMKKKKLICLPPPTAVAKHSNQKIAASKQQFMMYDLQFTSAAALKHGPKRMMIPRRRMLIPRRKFVEILDSSSDEQEEEEEESGVPLLRTVDARDDQHTGVDKIRPERLCDRKLIYAHEVKYVSKRPRDVTEEERFKAIAAARACAKVLPNISLMLVMRSSEVYHDFHLEMPAQFIRETKLQLPLSSSRRSWVALLDCDNKSWEVLIRRVTEQNLQQQNCLLLSPKGWARFALDHVLEEGDACVFELVSNSPELPMFRVHIFHVLPLAGENPPVADSDNKSHVPDQTSDCKILNVSMHANRSHDHELGNAQCICHPHTAAGIKKLPSIINICSLNVCNPKPVLMEGYRSKFNDGSTTTTTSGQWRTTTVDDNAGGTMQRNRSPTAPPAPSRSCSDQQDDLAAFTCTPACTSDDDDEQLPHVQSKLFAADDHEPDTHEEAGSDQRRPQVLVSILPKPSTWRNPHYDTLLETFG